MRFGLFDSIRQMPTQIELKTDAALPSVITADQFQAFHILEEVKLYLDIHRHDDYLDSKELSNLIRYLETPMAIQEFSDD